MFCKFASVFCVASLLMTSISANPTEEAGSLRHRRSPTVGLPSLQGQHHGHQLREESGHIGGSAFPGSSAKTSAGTSNVGHGPHGNSGSQSLASSHSHASAGSSNSGSHSFASSHSQAANFGSLRHRRSPTVGLLSLQGQHHGHHLGGQGGHFGGGAFPGSSAQTSAGTSNVGHGLHGNSGSQSLASSHSHASAGSSNSGSHSFASSRSQAANFGMSPYNAGAPAGGRNGFYGAGGYF